MPQRTLSLYTHFLETSSASSMQLVPSLKLPFPKEIAFCSDLPITGAKLESLPLDTFEKQITQQRHLSSFTWAASNVLPQKIKENYEDLIINSLPPSETIKELDELIQNPPPLIIANMGSLGYGLFAKEKIRKGCLVCTYMGRLIPSDRNFIEKVNLVYTLGVRTSSTLTALFEVDTEASDNEVNIDRSAIYPAFIDGSAYGNYGSFLQHLPEGHEDNNVATANLETIGADYRYYPCYYFRAKRDIEAGEILGFDYGENYWRGVGLRPLFFDVFGRVVK